MPESLGVYIHIPFCTVQCDFCAFDTHPFERSLVQDYLKGLREEITHYSHKDRIADRSVTSLYFGGGTPSLLHPDSIANLIDQIKNSFPWDSDCEITLEAHPMLLDHQKLKGFLNSGINRLSLGLQSLSNEQLHSLKRHHPADRACQLFREAREVGFQNINCDLIFGLSYQAPQAWRRELQVILELQPDHLSLYALTVEEDTPLQEAVVSGLIPLPEEEVQLQMYEEACQSLAEEGFHHYEISNFSRPNRECRHNLLYWQRGDYLGLGCSAHSSIGPERFSNLKTPQAYLQAIEAHGEARMDIERLSDEERFKEALVFGLRQTQGVCLRELVQRLSLPLPRRLWKVLADLKTIGVISTTSDPYPCGGTRLQLVEKGYHLADEVAIALMSCTDHDRAERDHQDLS